MQLLDRQHASHSQTTLDEMTHKWPLYHSRCSRSFMVTDFGNNCKPACDFMLVINTDLHHISHFF